MCPVSLEELREHHSWPTSEGIYRPRRQIAPTVQVLTRDPENLSWSGIDQLWPLAPFPRRLYPDGLSGGRATGGGPRTRVRGRGGVGAHFWPPQPEGLKKYTLFVLPPLIRPLLVPRAPPPTLMTAILRVDSPGHAVARTITVFQRAHPTGPFEARRPSLLRRGSGAAYRCGIAGHPASAA